MRLAIVHDYLTQRGGAERVVLSMLQSFPGAPIYTSLYNPSSTFTGFGDADVRVTGLNRITLLRAHHRLAFPVLAASFSSISVDADVLLCSSSGWAHGAHSSGRKVVYCHNPARWLYQPEDYLNRSRGARRAMLAVVSPSLVAWDQKAARSADRYLVNSSIVRDRVRRLYDLDPELLPPPPALDPEGPRRSVPGLEPGFFLCVSRLLAYKNVGAVVAAFDRLPGERLVVAGRGPDARRIKSLAGPNVVFLDLIDDDALRWLYGNCVAVVSAAHEDYGLTVVEGYAFGAPAIVLRRGGFLDTVVEARTGLFFEEAEPDQIAGAIRNLASLGLSRVEITGHAAQFSAERFIARLREVVHEEMSAA